MATTACKLTLARMAFDSGPSSLQGSGHGYQSGDGPMMENFLGGQIQGHISLSERGVRA